MTKIVRCDVAVIGAGPSGLAAAMTATSEGLTTRIFAEVLGGQAGSSPMVENYLGFPEGITGKRLAQLAHDQAVKFGADFMIPHLVVGISQDEASGDFRLMCDDGTFTHCSTVILAMGAHYRRLEVPGEERLSGRGVYYGSALTVAARFKGKPVAVVGGANSAAQSVLHLAHFASDVHLLVRGAGINSMSAYLVDRIKNTPNVEIHTKTRVLAIAGDKRVERVLVTNSGPPPATRSAFDAGLTRTIDVAAVFVFIGATPPTDWLQGVVELDTSGFVVANGELATSVPGIFAVGDVRAGSVKRVASAAGEGAMVVQYIHRYLSERES
jgi:thioredoxin reductase (NADPH)